MPAAKGEKPIFKDVVVALEGDLGGQWTEANIARWLALRSGTLAQDMSGAVTHLICGHAEFQRKGPKVRHALKRGKKACHIVTVDWLEDSITKKRRLPERDYSLYTALGELRRKEKQQVASARALRLEDKFVDAKFYRPYTDQTHFRYEVTLTRDTEEAQGERFILYLFESRALPRLYWFAAKHYRWKGDSQARYHRPSGTPRRFGHEFALFAGFFRKKTGLGWNARLAGAAAAAAAGGGHFRYEPPTGGKPVGVVEGEFAGLVHVPKGPARQEALAAGDPPAAPREGEARITSPATQDAAVGESTQAAGEAASETASQAADLAEEDAALPGPAAEAQVGSQGDATVAGVLYAGPDAPGSSESGDEAGIIL